jgi:hypothetical protein
MIPCTLRFPDLCRGSDGTVVWCHSNQGRDGKGGALKANDYRGCFGCYWCHAELDQGKRYDQEEKVAAFDAGHRESIGILFDLGWVRVA